MGAFGAEFSEGLCEDIFDLVRGRVWECVGVWWVIVLEDRDVESGYDALYEMRASGAGQMCAFMLWR